MIKLLRNWLKPAPARVLVSKDHMDIFPEVVRMAMRRNREAGHRFRDGADEAVLMAGQKVALGGREAVMAAMCAEIERQELAPCICGHWH